MRGAVVIAICFGLTGFSTGGASSDVDDVYVTTDQSTYGYVDLESASPETVIITLHNRGETTIFLDGGGTIHIYHENESVYAPWGKPPITVHLNPGEDITYEWDMRTKCPYPTGLHWCRALPGEYRVEWYYGFDEARFASVSFTIRGIAQ